MDNYLKRKKEKRNLLIFTLSIGTAQFLRSFIDRIPRLATVHKIFALSGLTPPALNEINFKFNGPFLDVVGGGFFKGELVGGVLKLSINFAGQLLDGVLDISGT